MCTDIYVDCIATLRSSRCMVYTTTFMGKGHLSVAPARAPRATAVPLRVPGKKKIPALKTNSQIKQIPSSQILDVSVYRTTKGIYELYYYMHGLRRV